MAKKDESRERTVPKREPDDEPRYRQNPMPE